MAKEDFCFTYYDGDALRDMSHMNRLERGAYNDLVLQIRKFGHITIDQVKKCLGKDFEGCWESIELVLKRDDDGKYFIDWLEMSIKKMRAHAQFQSEKGKQGGRGNKKKKAGKKPKQSPSFTEALPNKTPAKPLEDGDGIEDEFLKNKKESDEIFDFTKPDITGDLVIFPIDTPPMRGLWAAWKKTRWHNHRLRYKMFGEQAALKQLEGMDFHKVSETINKAIEAGWQNLYPDGKGTNGTGKTKVGNSKADQRATTRDYIANHYSKKPNGK